MDRPDQAVLTEGAKTHTFLIYDAASGEIVHGHKVLTLPYGKAASEKELLAQALDIAAQVTGRRSSDLRVLAVAEDELEPGSIYRVDPRTGRLQRQPAKGRANRRKPKGAGKRSRS